jgi:hypothetical protein
MKWHPGRIWTGGTPGKQDGGDMHSNIEPGREGPTGACNIPSAQKADATATAPQLADAATQDDTMALADVRRTGASHEDGRRMTAEREAQIRQRVLDGTYNSLSVVDEVARRLLRSADL